MPHTVKVLVAGDPPPALAEKGDVIEVVPSTSDWGSKTTAPNWIRLNVTGVSSDGDTQQGAEDRIRGYLSMWESGFSIADVEGAAEGLQRYRIEAMPELANDLSQEVKLQLRDAIVARMGGTVADQGGTFVEIDAAPGWPHDEIMEEIRKLKFRRFNFAAALVDNALSGATEGEPLEFTRTFSQVQSLINDKLKS